MGTGVEAKLNVSPLKTPLQKRTGGMLMSRKYWIGIDRCLWAKTLISHIFPFANTLCPCLIRTCEVTMKIVSTMRVDGLWIVFSWVSRRVYHVYLRSFTTTFIFKSITYTKKNHCMNISITHLIILSGTHFCWSPMMYMPVFDFIKSELLSFSQRRLDLWWMIWEQLAIDHFLIKLFFFLWINKKIDYIYIEL